MTYKETSYAECTKPNWIVFVVFEALQPMYYFGVINRKMWKKDMKFTNKDRVKLTEDGNYRTMLFCIN